MPCSWKVHLTSHWPCITDFSVVYPPKASLPGVWHTFSLTSQKVTVLLLCAQVTCIQRRQKLRLLQWKVALPASTTCLLTRRGLRWPTRLMWVKLPTQKVNSSTGQVASSGVSCLTVNCNHQILNCWSLCYSFGELTVVVCELSFRVGVSARCRWNHTSEWCKWRAWLAGSSHCCLLHCLLTDGISILCLIEIIIRIWGLLALILSFADFPTFVLRWCVCAVKSRVLRDLLVRWNCILLNWQTQYCFAVCGSLLSLLKLFSCTWCHRQPGNLAVH